MMEGIDFIHYVFSVKLLVLSVTICCFIFSSFFSNLTMLDMHSILTELAVTLSHIVMPFRVILVTE